MRSFVRRLLKRYLVVMLAFFIAYVLIKIYYIYFYNGLNDQVSEGLFWEALSMGLILGIVSIKYLLFDALAIVIIDKAKERSSLKFVGYLGTILAFAIDLFAIFAAVQPTTDAGFALLIIVTLSPLILLVSLAIMLIILTLQKLKLRGN